MADADVQGMLIRIEATTAQLRQEIARGDAAVGSAANSMDRNLQRVDDAFDRTGENASALQKTISSAFTAASLAAGAAVAGLVAITTKTAEYATQVKSLSALSNTSTEQFQRLTAGARSVGIEQEKLADIFKDTTDRVGEFLQRGGGEMADFFKEIAPKVGVTAQMFRDLSGPDALQLFYTSLEKAGLNQQQMTTYMESMADEATSLIPLLRNGGAGFQEFGEKAAKAGNILTDIQLDQFAEIDQTIKTLGSSFDGASRQLANGLLPGIVSVSEHLSAMSDNGAMEVIGAGIGFLAGNLNILVAILGAKVAASFTSYASQVLISTKSTLADALAAKANALAKAEQAAAAAGLAAALAKEASATVVGTRAAEAAAMAKVRVIQAARDQLAYQAAITVGTSEAIRYTRALAATELELAAAKKVAAQASLQLGVVLNAETAALARDTVATAADAAAKTQLAAASSLAARAGSGLLAILGGPAGIAALAVGVGIAFLTMRDSTDQAALSLDDMKAPLDQVIAKFKTLNEDQRKAALVRWGEAQAAAAKTAAGEFGNLAASIRAATVEPGQARLGRYSVQLKEYTALIDRLKDAQANGQALAPILEGLRGKAGIDNAQIDSWIKQAGAVSDAGVVLKDVTLKLNEQSGALNANTAETNANNTAKEGMSAAGSTYLQALQKQLAGLQDGGDATKIANRYISEHAELTETDRVAILDAAGAIEANKEATKRATAETKSGTGAAKEAATEAKNQVKALADLKTQTDIAIASATGLAAAYLAGTDKSREFSLQQKVEEALLKTGARARADVEKAIKAQQDAQDKLAVSKSAYDLGKETADLIDQARATLMGADALAAYNSQKSLTIALAGKNIEVGSKEYEQLLLANKAQQDALKLAQQAANSGGIMDRLYPEAKLLKDYTEDQKALNAAMELYPENAANYQAALVKLGGEYEVNRSKATLWGQMTGGAIDRIDEAFATAWGSIGDGAESLWDNLKKGFKQTLGEIAHMLTTKPLLASISNFLTGADNGQGLTSVWGKLLGSASGSASGGSGGLGGLGGMASLGKNLYSAYSAITGVGSSVASGYASGGIGGAISGGAGYYGNMIASIGSTLSSGFTSLASTITGTSAVQTAAILGAEGVTSAAFAGAVTEGAAAVGAQFTTGVATTSAATYAAAEAGAAATAASLGGQISAAMSSMAAMWPLAVVAGMYQSGKLYDKGVRPDSGEIIDSGGKTTLGKAVMAPGAAMSGFFEAQDKALSKVVGGKWAAILSGSTLHQAVTKYVGEKLFGGAWETKNTGIALEVENGRFEARQYADQEKKGGLFSSSGSRTRYAPLGGAAADSLGGAYNDKALGAMGLISQLNVAMNANVLDGLNVAKTKIKTKGKTEEYIQTALDNWMTKLGDSAVAAINASTNAGLDGFTFAGLTTFVNNLYNVNASFAVLGVKMVDFSVAGGRAVDYLAAMAGGIETLQANITSYYDNFTSDAQKSTDSLEAIRAQFVSMGITLPGTRDAYKDMLQQLDMTTGYGQTMFNSMTASAAAAASAYSILEQRQADYYGAFYSESENAERLIRTTTDRLKEMGVTLPVTRDGFRSMVEALDQTTATGKAMYDTLMSVAGSAGTVFDALESQASAAAQVVQAAADAAKAAAEATAQAAQAAAQAAEAAAQAFTDKLMSAVTGANGAVQRALSAQQKAATAAYNATTASLNDLLSAATSNISGLTSVGNDLSAALKALRGDSDGAVKMLRAQAQATLQSALATARAGGSLSGFAGLEDALDTIGRNNTDLYGSLEDFNRDQGRTANVVAELSGITGKQISAAEKSLKGLEEQIDLAKSAYELQMSQYDSDLAFAQAQLDALNGIDNSVIGVSAALASLNAAVIAALQSQPAGAAQANTPQNNGSIVDTLYQSVLGRGADADGKAYWTNKLQSGALSYQQIAESLAKGALAFDSGSYTGPVSQDALAASKAAAQKYLDSLKVPGFASGGDFGGGLRLVGERGPELEVTGPSRIFNANQTASMLNGGRSNAGLVVEIRALGVRLDMIQANTQAGALNGGKTVKLLDRVTEGGNAMQVTLSGETVKTKEVA